MDIVFNAPDEATLLAEADRLGFTVTDKDGVKHIATTGPVTGGGSFFITPATVVQQPTGKTVTIDGPHGPVDIPEMAPLPGVWGRLRINGDPSNVPQFSATITQYKYVPGTGGPGNPGTPGFWSVDGKTPAPDYVANIGVIA